MNVSTALTLIKRQFGDEYGVVINDDDIYGWIYSAENDIIRNSGNNDALISAAANTFPLAVPSNVTIKRVTLDGTVLTYTSIDQIDIAFPKGTTGSPQYWYIEDNTVSLFPVGTSGSVSILYNKVPTLMTGIPTSNAFTVPEVYHDDIVTYCVSKAHNKNNNLAAEKQMRDLYDRNTTLRNHEGESADVIQYKGIDIWDYE